MLEPALWLAKVNRYLKHGPMADQTHTLHQLLSYFADTRSDLRMLNNALQPSHSLGKTETGESVRAVSKLLTMDTILHKSCCISFGS